MRVVIERLRYDVAIEIQRSAEGRRDIAFGILARVQPLPSANQRNGTRRKTDKAAPGPFRQFLFGGCCRLSRHACSPLRRGRIPPPLSGNSASPPGLPAPDG